MLANILAPYDDEMLYSWFERNALINGYDTVTMMLKDIPSGNPYAVIGATSYLPVLFHFLNVANWAEMYVKHTEFPFVAPFLMPYRQIAILNSSFGIDSFNTNAFVKTAKVCPECQKEKPYIRVWHNLPGVEVCHKHNCKLVEVKHFFEIPENLEAVEPVKAVDISYAEYSHALHEKNLCCDVSYINRLFGNSSNYPFKKQYDYVMLLMEKYPSVDQIPVPPQEAEPSLPDDYQIVNQYGSVIEFVHMPCGTHFCTTSKGFSYNFQCPKCVSSLTEAERFEKYIDGMTEGKYRLIGPYDGHSRNVRILHKECGVSSSYRPISFLQGARCKCENCRTMETLLPFFSENYPDFTPVDYRDSTLTLRHNKCGNTFKVSWKDWTRRSTCRICDPVKRLDEETVRSEVENYGLELIGFFKEHGKTKVTFKCSEGHVSTVGLYHLQDIQDCPQCIALSNPKYAMGAFYRFIKATYSNSLFFYDDMLSLFGHNTKRLLQLLRDKHLIVLVAQGCYRLPEVTVSSRDVIEQKYMNRNGEHIGYLYGTSFLYYCLGIGEEPDRLSIATVKEAKAWARLTRYNNTELRLKAVPENMNEDNWQIIQVADFINGITSYCHSPADVVPALLQYINEKELPKQDIIKLMIKGHWLIEPIKMGLEDEKEEQKD